MRTSALPRLAAAAIATALILTLAAPEAHATEALPFLTGFEPDDTPAYAEGDLDGQGSMGSWSVAAGAAQVQTGTVARGAQAVELQSGSSASVSVSASNTVVWTDLYLRTDGSTNAPAVPGEPATSVLFFSATNGLMALDGDGAGGGSFVSVVGSFPGGQFARVSVRQDYAARTYDVWVNDAEEVTGLGFMDDSLTEVSEVEVASEGQSYLDDLSVTIEGLDIDSDTDHLVDLDELKLYGTLPNEADTDGDTMIDGDEVFVGTSATDSNDVYRVILTGGTGPIDVAFDTVAGRTYDVQVLTDLVAGNWSNAFANIPGDGSTMQRTVDGADAAKNVRVAVKP